MYTTDLSEGGSAAFAYAASLCRRYKAELTVFHTVEQQRDLAKELVGYMDEKLWEEIKGRDLDEAKQLLINRKRNNIAINQSIGEYCTDIQSTTPQKPFVNYNIEVQIGDPVECITSYAEKVEYDLIIMGHVSQSKIHEAVIGSTVRRVLRRTKVPVLVIRTDT